MSDTLTAARLEPIVDPGPGTAPYVPPGGPAPATSPPPAAAEPTPPQAIADQLARLEDKTARIEEKLSRAEASTQRVVDRFEASSHRMSEVAQQSDLAAVRGDVKFVARRVRNLPGFTALVLSAAITAVLTSALTIAIIRYLPGLLAR